MSSRKVLTACSNAFVQPHAAENLVRDPAPESILVQLNAMAYQIGEMTLGVGATFLCLLLFRTRLIPRWLAISGLIGYPCLVAGTIAEVFGFHIGLYLTMPGFFFELVLPVWLLTKGFQPTIGAGSIARSPREEQPLGCLNAGQHGETGAQDDVLADGDGKDSRERRHDETSGW